MPRHQGNQKSIEELNRTIEQLNSKNTELAVENARLCDENSELNEQNKELQFLFSSDEIRAVFLDNTLAIRRFTAGIAGIFQLEPSDIGKPLASFPHRLLALDLNESIKQVLLDGKPMEQEVSDDDHHNYFLRILPYRVDDRIDGVIIIFTTIDRVIESRRLAKKAQRRLQQAIDAVPFFVSFVNRDQIYEYTNQAYRKFLSVAEEEIIGKSIRELIGEESYKFSRHYAEAALEGQQQSFESTLSTSSGQMYVSVTYTPARDVNDQVVGFFVSATDISKMREAKAKLSEAVQIAKQANQAKSDFLAKMSHEIRSPMTAILGFSDILKEQLEDVDNQNCIEIIQKNGYHLLEIINDILDLSRIESGKFELDSEDFTPAVVLRECHNSLLPRAVDNAVSLDIRTDRKTELPLTGDRRRVKQIVLNLLTNSIKFSAHGLVHLRSAVIKDERFWTITVADTGCGIADEDLPKLFEPFCQVDDSDVRAFEGTGLGLTITSQLVEQMGGSLRVRSKVGVGTVMRVRLPWAKSQVDETSEITAVVLEERMPRLDSVVVLVIDDRRDIRFIVEHLLTDVGAIVYTAESGVAGLDILERCRDSNQPLNFIVTDIQMPEMDGFETARRLRKADYTGPILALSASAMKEDREKAIKAGCNDHIAKPIDKRRLVGKITELLGHHQRLRAEED